jgi:uncharacterized protein YbjT (DUF2867 family)
MRVLVIGGTGTVGSQVVHGLQARGVEVGVHSRDSAKAQSVHPQAAVHTGDLVEPATVREIFKGYDGAFLLNHTTTTETHEALMCLDGAMLNGVKRFVYMTIHDLQKALHLPHFGAKLAAEEALKKSKMEWTIIRPNNFYQNDYWFKDALLQYSVYPQPLGLKGLHRVDVRDIAEASVAVLTQSGHAGQVYDLVGPDVITGPGSAELWSKALGKTVNYGGEDMDAWEKVNSQWFPAFLAFDYRLMYEFFQNEGLLATPAAIERVAKVLGHGPRRYEDFVKETAESWKS